MSLTPSKIYQEFMKNKINKQSVIYLLITLIDNSEDENVRLESLQHLENIDMKSAKIFKLLEELIISDSSRNVRLFSVNSLQKYFLDKALSPMKWAIQYETDYFCLIAILETLADINNRESKKILIGELKKIKKKKFIDDNQNYSNRKFKESISSLLKHKKLKAFTPKELAEIIINYKTLIALIKKYYTIFYELENGLISKLDLSEIGWNVWNVWRQRYSDRIINISEIPGLKKLKHLKILDLSNNRIKSIKDLVELKSLTHLYLSNNKLEDLENIEYLKRIHNLKYVDLSNNIISSKVRKQDFLDLDITLSKGLTFM